MKISGCLIFLLFLHIFAGINYKIYCKQTGVYMKTGTVKMWDSGRGFGFITLDDEDDDIFVNIADIHPSVRGKKLFEGQKVKFDVKTDMKGDKAVNVRLA